MSQIQKTWEVINSVIKSKRVSSKISLTDETDQEYEESSIPSVFIEYYSTIASKLKTNIQPSQQTPDKYLKNKVEQSFFMTPISHKEVEDVINELKPNGNKIHSIATSVLKSSKKIRDSMSTLNPVSPHQSGIRAVLSK